MSAARDIWMCLHCQVVPPSGNCEYLCHNCFKREHDIPSTPEQSSDSDVGWDPDHPDPKIAEAFLSQVTAVWSEHALESQQSLHSEVKQEQSVPDGYYNTDGYDMSDYRDQIQWFFSLPPH